MYYRLLYSSNLGHLNLQILVFLEISSSDGILTFKYGNTNQVFLIKKKKIVLTCTHVVYMKREILLSPKCSIKDQIILCE